MALAQMGTSSLAICGLARIWQSLIKTVWGERISSDSPRGAMVCVDLCLRWCALAYRDSSEL